MAQKLFDKPMSALREAFVRARFAERKMFGREDVFEWLTNPEWTGIIDFDAMPAVVTYVEEAWKDFAPDQELERLATPTDTVPEWMHGRVNDRAAYDAVMDSLVAGGGKNFYPWVNDVECHAVVCIRGMVLTSIPFKILGTAKREQSLHLGAATVRDVLEIISAEVKGARPRAETARKFLSRTALNAAARIRRAAERDFDEAVAVSADGTKIVKATWVVVASANADDPSWIYPSSAFRNDKIRRPKNQDNFRSRGFASSEIHSYEGLEHLGTKWFPEPDAFRRFTDDLRHHFVRRRRLGIDESQRLVWVTEHLIRGVESVLIAMPDDCPSPLPVGGRELR